MSFFNMDININWEWPAGRKLEHRVVSQVLELKTAKKMLQSPSIVGNLPEPMSLRVKVLQEGHFNEGVTITLILPKAELEGITSGSRVLLGMVDNDTAVCVIPMPDGLSDAEQSAWLEQAECSD